MSEREFELYLSVLGGMMKLSARQRKDLAEELRSHMDERLDALMSEGLTRDEAIQTALSEFGDAAGLAANFTQIARLKQRRRIMRWTSGTIAATTCAILTLASFWPQENPVGQQIVSQSRAQSAASGGSGAGGIVQSSGVVDAIDHDARRAAIEKKLAETYPGQVAYIDLPVSEILHDISAMIEVDILLASNAREEIDLSQPINLELQYGKVSTKTLLSLLFEQIRIDEEFSYIVRDEILYITYKDQTMTVRVYNCRDLVGEVSDVPPGAEGGFGPDGFDGGGAGDEFGAETSETSFVGDSAASDLCQFGGGGFGGGSGGGFGGGEGYGMEMMGGMGMPQPARHELVSVVTHTIAPDSWSEVGGMGSARLFNGLLVIKNTSEVQQQVEDLLQMIRLASLQESNRK